MNIKSGLYKLLANLIFLLADEHNLSYYTNKGGCALVDNKGRYVIPYSEDILYIRQYDYLPANTFYAVCKNHIRKVYDTNGTVIFEGIVTEEGNLNEVKDHFAKK